MPVSLDSPRLRTRRSTPRAAPEGPRSALLAVVTPAIAPVAVAVVAAVAAGCAGAGAGATPAAPPAPADLHGLHELHAPWSADVAERVARVRATYHEGMERVLAAAARDPRTATYWPLRGLAEFWRGSVGWLELAELRQAASPAADAAGEAPRPLDGQRGWLAVVPPRVHGASPSDDALQLAVDGGANVIRIQLDQVTEVWAGLFLVHELAHLADRVQWGEPATPSRHAFLEAELRAAELEMAAATAVTGGTLLTRLDAALDELAPRTITELADRTLKLEPAAIDALASGPLSQPPASATEQGMRRSFFRTALVLRYADREKLDAETLLLGLDTLLLFAAD